MKVKKRVIKYKKERVVISDILPYEIPVTFSNRHFYEFLTRFKVEAKGNKIFWKKGDNTTEEIIKLLFGIGINKLVTNRSVNNEYLNTIPFAYRISHKDSDFRELAIIHPKNQLTLVAFYEKYKELILNYCSISPFSIRRAFKIAKFRYYKDETHRKNLAANHETELVEEHDKEYEHLKTYFVYKDFSNVHKFYESYKYHRCEKKYNKLFKFDISKCFDSIYTHSVSWALLNKSIVKASVSSSESTFGGQFDLQMQGLNYNEANGIVIGPEFSRIFAELILQRIDCNVLLELREKNIIHKRDFEVFRYVDDYFVFYNEDPTKDEIFKLFRLQLKEYKLSINDSKTDFYSKPLITEITIAKQKISTLLNKYLAFTTESDAKMDVENEISKELHEKGEIYVSSNKLITKFKTIIKETKIEYKDILNYTLSIIERRVQKILFDYTGIVNERKKGKQLSKAILEILDFVFFIYAVSPRVNTTIKLCRILRRLTEFLPGEISINVDLRHLIYKKVYDNIYFVLHKNKSVEYAQVETLYLLIALGELGKEYWLDAKILCSYFNIEKDEHGIEQINSTLNYFSITILLFYIRDKKRYEGIKRCLKLHILTRFRSVDKQSLRKHSEYVLLLLDLIVCPYLDELFKREILQLFEIDDSVVQDNMIKARKFWFTKWTEFDFGKELDAKQSQEPY